MGIPPISRRISLTSSVSLKEILNEFSRLTGIDESTCDYEEDEDGASFMIPKSETEPGYLIISQENSNVNQVELMYSWSRSIQYFETALCLILHNQGGKVELIQPYPNWINLKWEGINWWNKIKYNNTYLFGLVKTGRAGNSYIFGFYKTTKTIVRYHRPV